MYVSHSLAKIAEMITGPGHLTTEVVNDWKTRAACAGYPSTIFFPDGDSPDTHKALSICGECPVTEDCLEYALATNQVSGIWGGTTEEERRSLRRKWLSARRR